MTATRHDPSNPSMHPSKPHEIPRTSPRSHHHPPARYQTKQGKQASNAADAGDDNVRPRSNTVYPSGEEMGRERAHRPQKASSRHPENHTFLSIDRTAHKTAGPSGRSVGRWSGEMGLEETSWGDSVTTAGRWYDRGPATERLDWIGCDGTNEGQEGRQRNQQRHVPLFRCDFQECSGLSLKQ